MTEAEVLFRIFLKSPLFFEYFYVFIYLAVPGHRFCTWDLVPQPGIKLMPPALGSQSLSHWTTREVPLNAPLTGLSGQ